MPPEPPPQPCQPPGVGGVFPPLAVGNGEGNVEGWGGVTRGQDPSWVLGPPPNTPSPNHHNPPLIATLCHCPPTHPQEGITGGGGALISAQLRPAEHSPPPPQTSGPSLPISLRFGLCWVRVWPLCPRFCCFSLALPRSCSFSPCLCPVLPRFCPISRFLGGKGPCLGGPRGFGSPGGKSQGRLS